VELDRKPTLGELACLRRALPFPQAARLQPTLERCPVHGMRRLTASFRSRSPSVLRIVVSLASRFWYCDSNQSRCSLTRSSSAATSALLPSAAAAPPDISASAAASMEDGGVDASMGERGPDMAGGEGWRTRARGVWAGERGRRTRSRSVLHADGSAPWRGLVSKSWRRPR
jgi:hypothetical protein